MNCLNKELNFGLQEILESLPLYLSQYIHENEDSKDKQTGFKHKSSTSEKMSIIGYICLNINTRSLLDADSATSVLESFEHVKLNGT